MFRKPNIGYFALGVVFTIALVLVYQFLFTLKGSDSFAQSDGSDFPQGYKIISPEFPAQMNFAGESVPMDNFEVYERIDREFLTNTYWHSFTLLSIKRANRWFPVIEPILKKNGLPDDFKYVALIESGLANAISPAGATGFWQFIEGTALEYGLEVNEQVDERYDIEKSTEAACRYIRNAYNLLGSWTLAAASYNMGIPGIQKQMERQLTKNYYNLVLSDETSRYIFRVLALKEILINPARYGYYVPANKLYPPLRTHTVTVDFPVDDWARFAVNQGYNYKILKYYNPWLRDIKLSNKSGKSYSIQLPDEGSISIIKE